MADNEVILTVAGRLEQLACGGRGASQLQLELAACADELRGALAEPEQRAKTYRTRLVRALIDSFKALDPNDQRCAVLLVSFIRGGTADRALLNGRRALELWLRTFSHDCSYAERANVLFGITDTVRACVVDIARSNARIARNSGEM